MKRITIIGGGASGTLLAVNLLKHADEHPLEINLIEKSQKVGRGAAYSTTEDAHLLNVPAGKMGAFPDHIEHFHEWLTAKGFDFAPTDFVPRRIYGEYLREVFADAVAAKNHNVAFNIYDDEAIDVATEEDSALVLLKSGEIVPSSSVVLAFGNFPPPDLPGAEGNFDSADKYFRNAYDASLLGKIAAADDVTLIGTGLTAVDNIISLHNAGHAGKITAISTHGWLPQPHAPAAPYQSFNDELKSQPTIFGIFRTISRHCRQAENWRGVIDSLRPATQELWQQLSIKEKRYFMKRLRRVWDVMRHRIPPQCARTLEEMQRDGKLEIIAGKISDIKSADGKFVVAYKHHGAENSLTTDVLINCTGSESDFRKVRFPLVQNLLEKGVIRPDALALGLEATPDGKIIDRRNTVSKVFSTLGTSLKGILWESTAMPEIRVQARKLAFDLLTEKS